VLRLHPYEYHRPGTVQEAIALLAEHAGDAIPIAGGTDLVPNMKHGLFTPGHLVSLRGIDGMRGIAEDAGGFTIGAATTLDSVARNEAVLEALPSLARACALVSGPQLRRMGTIGGNVCLDTRCTYYNQTLFWRKALGYCLKKDGDACHVVKGGTRCVAAHSADAATALLPLEAELRIAGPDGERWRPSSGSPGLTANGRRRSTDSSRPTECGTGAWNPASCWCLSVCPGRPPGRGTVSRSCVRVIR
jgi:4-hydroxybenzoyl-CoA reductase subunit beta